MKSKIIVLTASLALFTPLIAFAQTTTNIGGLYTLIIGTINTIVVPTIFAIGFVMFLYGVYHYFIAGGASEEKVQEGQKFVMWSVVGFVLMISLWGLVILISNTFGFAGASMPGLPQFNPTTTTGATGSGLGNLFGTGNANTTSASSYDSTVNPAGSTLVNGVAMPNTMSGAGGTCPTGYTLSNGTCYLNAAYPNGPPSSGSSSFGSGGGSTGASCTNNTQCGQGLACNDATGTCQADGPNTYSCSDDSTPNASTGLCANGSAPSNSLGQEAPSDGTVGMGGSCAGNEDACSGNLTCDDNGYICDTGSGVGGGGPGASCSNNTQCGEGYACNDATGTCQADGANTYSCSDDSTPNADGICANGSSPTNSLGQQAAEDGTVGLGGSCAGNEAACSGNLTCDDAAGYICDNSESANNSDGSASASLTTCDDGSQISGSCYTCQSGESTNNSGNCAENGGYE